MTPSIITYDGKQYELTKRDSQKGKLYKAEEAAFGAGWLQGTWGKLLEDTSVEGCKKEVDRVINSKTWKKILKKTGTTFYDVKVKDGRGARIARGCRTHIKLPKWSRSFPIILHELAHSANRHSVAHHWPFVATYIALVSRFISPDAAQRLRVACRERRVRWTPITKRKLTDARREALRERGRELAAARKRSREGEIS